MLEIGGEGQDLHVAAALLLGQSACDDLDQIELDRLVQPSTSLSDCSTSRISLEVRALEHDQRFAQHVDDDVAQSSVSRMAQASASDGVSSTLGSRWRGRGVLRPRRGSGMRRSTQLGDAARQGRKIGATTRLKPVWKLITGRPGSALDGRDHARRPGQTNRARRRDARARIRRLPSGPGARPRANPTARPGARSRRRHWRRARARARRHGHRADRRQRHDQQHDREARMGKPGDQPATRKPSTARPQDPTSSEMESGGLAQWRRHVAVMWSSARASIRARSQCAPCRASGRFPTP